MIGKAPEGMITVEEFSEKTKISTSKVIELIKAGLYAGRIVDGYWFISLSELSSDVKITRPEISESHVQLQRKNSGGMLMGAAKVGVAIFGAIAAIALVVLGVYAVTIFRNSPLEEPKVWNAINIESLDNSRLLLITRWKAGEILTGQNGTMLYQFEVRGYPKSLQARINSPESLYPILEKPVFIITFLDSNGFKLFQEELSRKDMTQLIGDDGKPVGFVVKGDTYASASEYRKATNWEVTWSF